MSGLTGLSGTEAATGSGRVGARDHDVDSTEEAGAGAARACVCACEWE